ncbi:MAG: beta-glucosidase [Myxococcales bacterium]|nr:beta-glucosidase [Myxococcales bacterium]
MFKFPDNFVWGVATSSFQIEGAVDVDGRSESIWDRLCKRPGAIADNTNGDVACDHYNRWPEDVKIMSDMGVGAYRFSVAWPRIIPTGRGATNQKGIDFYSRLVDGLLEAGIDPCVTLYHWDLPQILEDQGGWTNRDTAYAFADYTETISRALGDRVKTWVTINEPWCISVLGYINGEHAPGIKNDWPKALSAAHHVMLGHGLAVPIIRDNVPDGEVGITVNLVPNEPASQSGADRDACRHFDGFFNRWYLDPVFGRGYPADRVADLVKAGEIPSSDLPFLHKGDLETIAADSDFLGINYYSRAVIRDEKAENNDPPDVVSTKNETDMGWEVWPLGLEQILVRLKDDYNPKAIQVTENGCAYATAPNADGIVEDTERIAYFDGHIRACAKAIEQGVPLTAYYAWSLLDNFEWAFGYEKRFGLVYVDYDTLDRTPKQSAHWYRDLIQKGGI